MLLCQVALNFGFFQLYEKRVANTCYILICPAPLFLSVNQAVRRRLGAAAHTADSRGPTGPIATHPSKAQFCPCPRPDSMFFEAVRR